MISFRVTLTIILLISCRHAFSQNSIQAAADAMVKDPLMQNAGISIYVYDVNKKEALASVNPKMSLSPASTMKLLSTATALEVLGAGYQYKTEILHTGTIDSAGVLHGDIIVKGGGDPTLGSKYYEKQNFNPFFMDAWVKAVLEKGIKKLDGRIITDASYFTDNVVPAGWTWGDIGNYFGAGSSGLNIYDNMIRLYFKSGNDGDSTKLARTFPYVKNWKLNNHISGSTNAGDNAYIYGAPYQNEYMGYGTITKNSSAFEVKASLPDPAMICAIHLDSVMRSAGIQINSEPTTERLLRNAGRKNDYGPLTTIYTHKSPYLSSIIWWTNMVSVNLFAETLLTSTGKVRGGDGSTYSGSIAVERFWASKGIDVTGMYVNDGSGLSRSNAISAKHFVDILTYMSASTQSKTFKESLPVAGKSGTLTGWCSNTKAAGNLMAKSGSMTRIKSHAGYVTTASGRSLAFAIIVNNYNATSYQLKTRIEAIMIAMANFNG